MSIGSATPELPAPRRWSMQVLGSFRLTDAAGAEIALPGKLDRALLTYLALNQRQRNPRTSLETLLWAERADPPHSLSESLKNLRKALGDTDGRVIALKSDPVVTDFRAMAVDALSFEQLVAQGTRAALDQAEALFAGELLEGFDIRSEEFEQWLATERSRLRDLLTKVLSGLLHLREQAGETDEAIETAHRVIRLDPLREEFHRSLIRLHLGAGRRSAALKAAQICEETLRREDNLVPEPETRRLIEEIRRSYEPPGLTIATPPRIPTEELECSDELPVSLPERPELITPDAIVAPQAEPSFEPATLVPTVGATVDSPHSVPAPPAETSAAEDTACFVPAPPDPRPRFEPRVRLGRLWLAVTFAIITTLVFSPVAYACWRYWNVPWLAPNPVDNVILAIKEVLPGRVPPSIAVLPFASPGGDAAAETLAQGLSEDIITALGRVSDFKDIKVIAAASVQFYGPSPPDLSAVARDLDVQHLLLGSVRQSGDQLRVQVQLVDANEGRQVWGNSYQGETGDKASVFDLEKEIARDVMIEVQVQLTQGQQERITAIHGTRNFDAWLATGEGLKLLRHLTPEDNARARLHYNRAIALDPSYAGAYEGLAWTHLLDAEFGWSPSVTQSLAEAQRLTQRALELGPERHRLYTLRGHLNLLLRNFDQAVADGEHAVEAERNDADAAALLAFTLTYTDEPNRAIALMRRAIELSPRPPAWYGWALGRAYRLAGDPRRAVATLEANLPERPASIIPLVELVIDYGEAGDSGMAKAMAATIREGVPRFSIGAWAALQPYENPAMTERDAAALRAAGLPD